MSTDVISHTQDLVKYLADAEKAFYDDVAKLVTNKKFIPYNRIAIHLGATVASIIDTAATNIARTTDIDKGYKLHMDVIDTVNCIRNKLWEAVLAIQSVITRRDFADFIEQYRTLVQSPIGDHYEDKRKLRNNYIANTMYLADLAKSKDAPSFDEIKAKLIALTDDITNKLDSRMPVPVASLAIGANGQVIEIGNHVSKAGGDYSDIQEVADICSEDNKIMLADGKYHPAVDYEVRHKVA